jgi:adenine-specific DNA-methyltransferase
MNKLKMETPNITDKNIEAIAKLFPNVITEIKDENGNERKAIDFDILKQILLDVLVEDENERYRLDWPGKKASLLKANTPITRTLRPVIKESVDFENTENLYIEGDNFEVLKTLQESYLGKIKMIYIDPPYNTGKDFIYKDNFKISKEEYEKEVGGIDNEGIKLFKENLKTNPQYHSDWLSMMNERLIVAYDLLDDDGVIFISIDDNEVANLRKIGDEIYGEDNFIAQLAVQINPRGRHLDKFVAKTHESVLIFGKNVELHTTMSGAEKEGKMIEEYNRNDEKGKHRVLGLRNRNQAFNNITRPNLYFPIYVNPTNNRVSTTKDDNYIDEVWPNTPNGKKTCWTWGKNKVIADEKLLIAEKTGKEWRVYRKDYLLGESGKQATTLPKSLWIDKEINNDYGRSSIKELFEIAIMDFPKSPGLIKKFITVGLSRDGIILDFFSGSATTAHSVMQLNAEDGGNRKFIMVQLPEKTNEKSEAYKAGYETIAEIGKERIRRAGKKIKKELETKNNQLKLSEEPVDTSKLDIGFRVYQTDSSNMKDVFYHPTELKQEQLSAFESNIKEDRTPEDLLTQVILDLGLELSLSIEKREILGNKIFIVQQNALVACFDDDINFNIVDEIAKLKPLKVVFKDASFVDDKDRINVEERFKRLSPETVIMVL